MTNTKYENISVEDFLLTIEIINCHKKTPFDEDSELCLDCNNYITCCDIEEIINEELTII